MTINYWLYFSPYHYKCLFTLSHIPLANLKKTITETFRRNMVTVNKFINVQLWNKVENNSGKRGSAYLCAKMFSKDVCCRGVRKSLYVGKG